jgi:hypothetical protein
VFTPLGSLRLLIAAKFNSKTQLQYMRKVFPFFEPSRPRLHSKIVKSANMIYLKNIQKSKKSWVNFLR